jgi:endonuclease III
MAMNQPIGCTHATQVRPITVNLLRHPMLKPIAETVKVQRLERIASMLSAQYSLPRHGNKHRAMDELVYILLSRQTNERNFVRAYRALKRRCRSWNQLLTMTERQLRSAISSAGFGRQRARELKRIARRLHADFGTASLKRLATLTDEAAEAYLTSLPGIGKKSARCILMYSMGRSLFPVDVHCFRILNRIGIIRRRGPVRNHEDSIQRIIPSSLRYTLHVTFVSLGRDVCHAVAPDCNRCCLRKECRFSQKKGGSK